MKYHLDGSEDRYKAKLVAKGYTQTYGVNFFETFSSIAHLNYIQILFSVAVNVEWLLFQLDIKNAFLYGDLKKKVIWGNLLGMLLRRRMMYADLGRQSMDSKRVQEHGLRSPAWLSLILALLAIIQITQFLFVILSLAQ